MRGQSSRSYCIGVDLMGSDTSPQELLRAVLNDWDSLPQNGHRSLILLGTEEVFSSSFPAPSGITYFPISEIISMDEPPLAAIRSKKNSSLCTGIRLLKEGSLHALISAGNTGALMGCAKLELSPIPGIDRPALLALLPTKNKELAVLDVGANTTCKAKLLVQHASLGIAYQHSRGIKHPRVGLLNIGSEACKGTPEIKEAYTTLEQLSAHPSSLFTFVGNIEGRNAFHGEIDVLVTDGFTGNVFLKTAEGIAAVILEQFAHETSKHLHEIRQRLNYAEYPGAILCGVQGIVIKCHGNISSRSLTRSIATAFQLAEHAFLAGASNIFSND